MSYSLFAFTFPVLRQKGKAMETDAFPFSMLKADVIEELLRHRFLRFEEAAAVLRVSTPTARRLVRLGRLRATSGKDKSRFVITKSIKELMDTMENGGSLWEDAPSLLVRGADRYMSTYRRRAVRSSKSQKDTAATPSDQQKTNRRQRELTWTLSDTSGYIGNSTKTASASKSQEDIADTSDVKQGKKKRLRKYI